MALSTLALALLSIGCPSVTTPGGDSAPADGSLGWRVRVLVGPGRPLAPGAGFAVRAENAAGQVFEQTAGADGIVPLGVAPEDGPWDVTVARAGCTAVSILGVTGGFDGNVYSECSPVRIFSPAHTHNLTVRVAGVDDISRGPNICPGGSITGPAIDRVQALFEYRPGMPPADVWAVQFENMNSRAHPLNVARLPPVSLLDQDMLVTVALPTTPVPVVRARIAVQFPTEGLLTAESAVGAAGYESVSRGLSANGAIEPCHVGRGTWTDPDASGRGTFEIESFAPPFDPDSAGIPLNINRPTAAVVGGLRLSTIADGAVVQIPPVRALSVGVDPASVLRFVVDAPGYDGGSFRAFAVEPNVHGSWVGYTAPGASLNGRRLPRLPSTVSLFDLTTGFGQTDHFAVMTCIASLRPGARPPWTPAGPDTYVSVCATATTPLTP